MSSVYISRSLTFKCTAVLDLRPLVLHIFSSTLLTDLHNFLIVLLTFRFNALWLAAFYHAKPLSLMAVLFLIMVFYLRPLFQESN
jgi:hypothetical protein